LQRLLKAWQAAQHEYSQLEDAYVCRETIYSAVYALPVGELRKEIIICLRQGKSTSRPRAAGVDRRGQLPDMVSIHVRPPEIEDRLASFIFTSIR
jgi:IS30 family transposase